MIAIVILAAGSSSRMGQPKQNLLFKNKTLLQHTVAVAKQIATQVIVTVGANKNVIVPTLKNFDINIIENDSWDEGMATSIVLAVDYILSANTEIDGIIFLLCDQPHINTGLLNELITAAESSEYGIVACTYGGTNGVPVYFKEKYFPRLLKLKGKEGAKTLLKKFSVDMKTIPFALGAIDIDTPANFKELQSGE